MTPRGPSGAVVAADDTSAIISADSATTSPTTRRLRRLNTIYSSSSSVVISCAQAKQLGEVYGLITHITGQASLGFHNPEAHRPVRVIIGSCHNEGKRQVVKRDYAPIRQPRNALTQEVWPTTPPRQPLPSSVPGLRARHHISHCYPKQQ